MKIIHRPLDARALHTGFSIAGTFTVALVAGLLSLTGAPSFGALAQQAYVKASNPGGDDQFGTTVAVSGDTMIVGAPRESSNAQGVNGAEDNDAGFYSGAAYIYVRSGTNWTKQAYLKASDSQFYFFFGSAVAIDGDTVVVGAPSAFPGGSAYVFVRSGTNWTQQRLLKASNAGGGFGGAVSVSGNTVVIGAKLESSDATGVNGVETNYTSANSGAAYVFVRSGTNWTQQAYLKASNADPGDQFGGAVGVAGDTIVIGAREERSIATGVDGDQGDNSSIAGAAYVFAQTGTNWTQQAYLKASNTGFGDGFGNSVAVFGDTAVIGAPGENSLAIGVNGEDNNLANDAGAAYVFVRTNGTVWTQQAYLKAFNTEAGDHFGSSVAVAGDTVVVGAQDEDSNAAGVNGNQGSNSGTNSGAAYLFTRSGTNWSTQSYLKASNPGGGNDAFAMGDAFGASVAISGGTLAIGAPGEASNATGVNGNQNDNSLPLAGAAYVFADELSLPAGPVVTGDQPGLNGTTHVMAYDGSLTTFFRSSFNDWQFLQVDFGEAGRFSGLRRYMTTDGTSTAGQRTTQGESVQHSMDGVTWSELTGANATGWQGYINYGARLHAWRDVPYGWSSWLNPVSPVSARYVRFLWDGDNDALNEVEINFTAPALMATVAFAPIADAETVSGQPGVNFGAQTVFSVAAFDGDESIRSYLRFNLSLIPTGAVIHAAQLEAYAVDVGGAGTRKTLVSAATAPWLENTVTWAGQPPATAPVAIQNVVLNQWHAWEVTALVQAWANGLLPHHGFALRPDVNPGETFSAVFSSRESPTNRPRLTVSYSLPPPPQNTAYLRLRQESVTPLIGYFNGGLPTSLQFNAPHPTNVPAEPLARAFDFLDRYRALYGLASPRQQLVPHRRTSNRSGRHIFFQQIHEGIPVFASELAVHLTAEAMTGSNGRWLTELPILPPANLSAGQAEAQALAWMEEIGVTGASLTGKSRPHWFNPTLLGPGVNHTTLTWRVNVLGTDRRGNPTQWTVFINAHNGGHVWYLDRTIAHAPEKDFDIESVFSTTDVLCWELTDADDEWFDQDGPTGYPGLTADAFHDSTNAWRFAHQTYDYFFNTFHRHSWDGAETEVEVMTHYGRNGNSFYSPGCDHLKFGNGWVTLDIFAHEFTHGVTESTAGLIYANESGALNESYSDVFAAMVDTSNWLIGEGIPPGADGLTNGGPVRNLSNPPALNQPDHVFGSASGDNVGQVSLAAGDSPDFERNDNGFVHGNSGIPNKAAWLLAEGGTFNGDHISGIGRAKVQQLYYDVLTSRLTCNSQFIDARNETIAQAREYYHNGHQFGFDSGTVCAVINSFHAIGLGRGDSDCDGFDEAEDDDFDGDHVPNATDNCLGVANWFQFDNDHDGQGDECDPDDDNDGVPDTTDNAPRTSNPDQSDRDGDGLGDVIDDSDLDGVLDIKNGVRCDNCWLIANRDQLDTDGDDLGDACDDDDDDDGVPDITDNAPKFWNPGQLDTDGDDIGDVIDKCPTTFTPPFQNLDTDGDGIGDVCDPDIDGDGRPNALDNCPISFNPDQLDLNTNGVGYACDPNERIAYPRFDAQRFEAEFRFINDARVLQLPLDFCVTPPCNEPLPEDFLTEMRLTLPTGLSARIVDDQGFVVAKGRKGGAQLLRFPPRSDWAVELPPDGPDNFFVRGPKAATAQTYRGASYTLEIGRDASVPSNVPLHAVIVAGTAVGSAARLEVRYETNRPVVTILGAPHREYRLESSGDLSAWTTVITASAADGRIVHTGDPVITGHRFYRAWLLP